MNQNEAIGTPERFGARSVQHAWLASRVSDAFYHFVITRSPKGCSVAFELASREAGHIANRIDHCGEAMVTDVDSRVEWYLAPDARDAWRAQRALGYLGDLESMAGKIPSGRA